MKNLAILILFFSVCLSIHSQMPFYKQFSGTGYDFAQGVVEMPDSSYIITGASSSFTEGPSQMFLLKIDSLGNYIWSNHYGGTEIDWGRRVKYIPNEGIYVGGHTNSEGNGNFDFALWKIDENGNLLWTKTYGSPQWERMHDMVTTSDSSIILIGETNNTDDGLTDILIYKVDLDGNIVWEKQIIKAGDDNAKTIIQFDDTTFFVGGYQYDLIHNYQQAWLTKIHQNGTIIWESLIGSDYHFNFEDLALISNIEVIAIGSRIDDTDQRVYMAKFDVNNGSNTYADVSPTDKSIGVGITQHINPNFFSICTEHSGQYSFGDEDIYFYLFDFHPYYHRNLGAIRYSTSQKFGEMTTTYNHGTIVVGYNNHIGPGGASMFVMRIGVNQSDFTVDHNFSTSEIVNLKDVPYSKNAIVYPNPFTDVLNLNTEYQKFELEIYDITGRLVQQEILESQENVKINLSHLNSGFYTFILKKYGEILHIEKLRKF